MFNPPMSRYSDHVAKAPGVDGILTMFGVNLLASFPRRSDLRLLVIGVTEFNDLGRVGALHHGHSWLDDNRIKDVLRTKVATNQDIHNFKTALVLSIRSDALHIYNENRPLTPDVQSKILALQSFALQPVPVDEEVKMYTLLDSITEVIEALPAYTAHNFPSPCVVQPNAECQTTAKCNALIGASNERGNKSFVRLTNDGLIKLRLEQSIKERAYSSAYQRSCEAMQDRSIYGIPMSMVFKIWLSLGMTTSFFEGGKLAGGTAITPSEVENSDAPVKEEDGTQSEVEKSDVVVKAAKKRTKRKKKVSTAKVGDVVKVPKILKLEPYTGGVLYKNRICNGWHLLNQNLVDPLFRFSSCDLDKSSYPSTSSWILLCAQEKIYLDPSKFVECDESWRMDAPGRMLYHLLNGFNAQSIGCTARNKLKVNSKDVLAGIILHFQATSFLLKKFFHSIQEHCKLDIAAAKKDKISYRFWGDESDKHVVADSRFNLSTSIEGLVSTFVLFAAGVQPPDRLQSLHEQDQHRDASRFVAKNHDACSGFFSSMGISAHSFVNKANKSRVEKNAGKRSCPSSKEEENPEKRVKEEKEEEHHSPPLCYATNDDDLFLSLGVTLNDQNSTEHNSSSIDNPLFENLSRTDPSSMIPISSPLLYSTHYASHPSSNVDSVLGSRPSSVIPINLNYLSLPLLPCFDSTFSIGSPSRPQYPVYDSPRPLNPYSLSAINSSIPLRHSQSFEHLLTIPYPNSPPFLPNSSSYYPYLREENPLFRFREENNPFRSLGSLAEFRSRDSINNESLISSPVIVYSNENQLY